MIQLALETTGKFGSLAVLQDHKVIWQQRVGGEKRAAADMALKLKAGLEFCRQHGRGLDFVSVAAGPGSFTGLRIAITTAKSLAYARGIPAVPVGSLAGIAASTRGFSPQNPQTLLVGLNAYRQQVFAARFTAREWGEFEVPGNWQDRVEVWTRSRWDESLADELNSPHSLVRCDESLLGRHDASALAEEDGCQAVGVGRIAASLTRGVEPAASSDGTWPAPYVSPFELSACYVKQSAAEEKAAKR